MSDALDIEADKCFRRSFVLKLRFRLLAQGLGPMHGRSALCVGPVDSPLQTRLQQLGGQWTFINELLDPETLGEGLYDRVLILDYLECVDDDYAFMAACHRCLKPAGLLLLDAAQAKRWTVWRPIRRLFGIEMNPAGQVRTGYTASMLFDLLKDGFDVQMTKSYSRFNLEGVDTVARLAAGALLGSDDSYEEGDRLKVLQRLGLLQTIFYPFYFIAYWMDMLLFFIKGYRLYAVARRRLWKPRRTPVLRDGRSLADATLNSKIGTATAF